MSSKSLSKIAKEIYFKNLGQIVWNQVETEVETEYGLSEMEINYVVSIIRNWNKM